MTDTCDRLSPQWEPEECGDAPVSIRITTIDPTDLEYIGGI
jgi:hypothetical protein